MEIVGLGQAIWSEQNGRRCMQVSQPLEVLDNLRVAAPCPASWAAMKGDARVRFCALCAKYVYNISAMTRAEAERLIFEKEGKLCVRLHQRADGTVITADCPVGRRLLRAAGARLALVAGAVFALLAAAIRLLSREGPTEGTRFAGEVQPVLSIIEVL